MGEIRVVRAVLQVDGQDGVPGVDVDCCVSELSAVGWKLVDWAPNEDAHARHMGIARLLDDSAKAEAAQPSS